MAKTIKAKTMNLDTKAADILFDAAQECGLSFTEFVERLAYRMAAMKKGDRQDFLQLVRNSREPRQ